MSTENKAEPLVSPKQLLRDAEEYMRGYLLLQRDSKLPAKTPMSAFAVAGYGAIVSRTYEADRQANLKTIADLRARVEATEADERRWRKTVERIMAVCTPHVATPEGRMTYTGPDIAERFALLSDEIVNALPTPTPTDHE